MRSPDAVRRPADAVPLADRTKVTQYLRVFAVVLVLALSALTPQALAPGRDEVVVATLGYGGLVVLADLLLLSARVRRGAVVVFSALLIADGVWLAAATYLTGGLESPLAYLVLLHVGAITLVASYRTGLKLALWHSLLLSLVVNAVDRGVLVPTDAAGDGPDAERVVVFTVVLWLVAVSTASLSAVNERELRRQRRELEVLARLAVGFEASVDAEHVARSLLDTLVDSFGFPRAAVLAGPDGSLPLLASSGLEPATADRPGRPGPSAVVDEAFRTEKPVLSAGLDPVSDAWLDHLLPGATNLVVLPLFAKGRPVGALVLEQAGRPGDRIARRAVSTVERAASYAALALRNAWLLEQVQRLAATDGLTKIANRRTFETTLEREVSRAVRAGETVSLVMVDIDHFKLLNDTHGHQAGDEVLRNVAAALSCECREFDTAARYGGEEFAIVLPDCGAEEAAVIGERLRRAVTAAPSVVPITASAGVATFPVHAGDPDTLVRAADEALYRSKHDGRDRTTVSEGVPLEAQVDVLLRQAVSQRLGRTTEPAAEVLPD